MFDVTYAVCYNGEIDGGGSKVLLFWCAPAASEDVLIGSSLNSILSSSIVSFYCLIMPTVDEGSWCSPFSSLRSYELESAGFWTSRIMLISCIRYHHLCSMSPPQSATMAKSMVVAAKYCSFDVHRLQARTCWLDHHWTAFFHPPLSASTAWSCLRSMRGHDAVLSQV